MSNLKKAIRQRGVFLKASLLFTLFFTFQASALKPEFDQNGALRFKIELAEEGSFTFYTAFAGGAGTWYYKYATYINNFCFGPTNYYVNLPYYGYTLVTAEKLATLLWYDPVIARRFIQGEVYNLLIDALNTDKAYHYRYKSVDSYWNPSGLWGWRYQYMINRYSENGIAVDINANCWGTADYLTRGYGWGNGYNSFKTSFISENQWEWPFYGNWNLLNWAASFPHIFLDGYPMDQYSLDNDLLDYYQWFDYEGQGKNSLKTKLNCFDVMRKSIVSPTTPQYAMYWPNDPNNPNDDIYLGDNYHGTVYLCTDRDNHPWFYEKRNNGATYPPSNQAEYGVRELAITADWISGPGGHTYMWSFFSHDGDMKLVVTEDDDENWYPVNP